MTGYNENTRIGHNTEVRVITILSKLGKCGPVFTNKGSPDLFFEPNLLYTKFIYSSYGVEVKSVKTFTGGKIGRIRINKEPWAKLLEWCVAANSRPLLIVEIRGRMKPIYIKIEGDKITDRFRKAGSVSLTIWEVIRLGEKL